MKSVHQEDTFFFAFFPLWRLVRHLRRLCLPDRWPECEYATTNSEDRMTREMGPSAEAALRESMLFEFRVFSRPFLSVTSLKRLLLSSLLRLDFPIPKETQTHGSEVGEVSLSVLRWLDEWWWLPPLPPPPLPLRDSWSVWANQGSEGDSDSLPKNAETRRRRRRRPPPPFSSILTAWIFQSRRGTKTGILGEAGHHVKDCSRKRTYCLFRAPSSGATSDDPVSANGDGPLKPTATRHILLIRHGQYNLKGKTDEERHLTELGRDQASLTGKRLKELDLKYTGIIVSRWERSIPTHTHPSTYGSPLNALIFVVVVLKHDSSPGDGRLDWRAAVAGPPPSPPGRPPARGRPHSAGTGRVGVETGHLLPRGRRQDRSRLQVVEVVVVVLVGNRGSSTFGPI